MPDFKPQKGQTDYTNIHWAPVINCVLVYEDKILILQRSSELNFYPNYWNGVSGFLDDNKSLKKKVKAEINEELGIRSDDIISIKLAKIFHQKAPQYNKTWIVHPVLVFVKTNKIKLDWETKKYKWIHLKDIGKYNLLPGFNDVIRETKKLL